MYCVLFSISLLGNGVVCPVEIWSPASSFLVCGSAISVMLLWLLTSEQMLIFGEALDDRSSTLTIHSGMFYTLGTDEFIDGYRNQEPVV